MSDPCREQIVKKFEALLESVFGITIDRNRRTAISTDELEQGDRVILIEDDEQPNDVFTGEDAFDLPLLVQFATGKSGSEGAAHCNAQRARFQQAMFAGRTLDGLARDLQVTAPGDWIGVDVDTDDAEGFLLSVLVRYATVEGDPFTFSH